MPAKLERLGGLLPPQRIDCILYNEGNMNQERQPYRELDTETLEAYAATFIPRADFYPLQLDTGSYITLHKPLHPGVVAPHLKGLMTMLEYSLDPTGCATW